MKRSCLRYLFLSLFLPLFLFTGTVIYAENPVYKVQESVDYKLRSGITHTFEKLRAGKSINVAYLGGSITAANGWRPKTTAWLQKNWSNAEIHEIHAAISGMGSYLGLFRLQRDVLNFKPDLLFVEFAVNDGGTPPEIEWRQMESIVRQTWLANPETDIVFVYTFCVGFTGRIQNGELPQSASAMEMLADYYGIPSVNFMKRVVEMESAGKLAFTPALGEKFHVDGKLPESVILWSQDGTHPLDAGHELYLQDIQRAFAKMEKMPTMGAGKTLAEERLEKLATPYVDQPILGAKMMDVTPEMLSGTWRKVEKNEFCFHFGRFLDTIWTTDEPGAKLTFTFRGREAQIYDVVGPTAGQVRVTVDGKTLENPLSRCDAYCVNYYSFRITSNFIVRNLDPEREHTVTLELLEEEPDRAKMADGNQVKPEDTTAEKYRGRNLWVGKILVY